MELFSKYTGLVLLTVFSGIGSYAQVEKSLEPLENRIAIWRDEQLAAIADTLKKRITLETFDLPDYGGLVYSGPSDLSWNKLSARDEILDSLTISAKKGARAFFMLTRFNYGSTPEKPHELNRILDIFNFFVFAALNKGEFTSNNTVIELSGNTTAFVLYHTIINSYLQPECKNECHPLYSEYGQETLIHFRPEKNTTYRYRWLGDVKAKSLYTVFRAGEQGFKDRTYLLLTDYDKLNAKSTLPGGIKTSAVLGGVVTTRLTLADLCETGALLLEDDTTTSWKVGKTTVWHLINKLFYILKKQDTDKSDVKEYIQRVDDFLVRTTKLEAASRNLFTGELKLKLAKLRENYFQFF